MGAPSNFDPEEYGNNGEEKAEESSEAPAAEISAETPPAEQAVTEPGEPAADVSAQDANETDEGYF